MFRRFIDWTLNPEVIVQRASKLLNRRLLVAFIVAVSCNCVRSAPLLTEPSIDLQVAERPLRDVIAEINSNYGVQIELVQEFDSEIVVSANVKDGALSQVLKKLLRDHSYTLERNSSTRFRLHVHTRENKQTIKHTSAANVVVRGALEGKYAEYEFVSGPEGIPNRSSGPRLREPRNMS